MDPTILPYRFVTGRARDPHPQWNETPEEVKPLNEFPLGIYEPKAGSPDDRHVVILINGFGDRTRDLYIDTDNHEKGLSDLLAANGMASILLPMPMHFWRVPHSNPKLAHWARKAKGWHLVPGIVCARAHERLYYGYEQIIADIRKLVCEIKSGAVCREFDSRTKVHLLGYSLGGLAALSAFLVDAREGDGGLDSCVLLCSGASLKHLVPDSLGIDSKRLKPIRDFYLDTRKLRKIGIDTTTFEFQVFRHLALSRKCAFAGLLEEVIAKVHLVAGMQDAVNPIKGIQQLLRRFSVLTVPDLDHELTKPGSSWAEVWAPYLVEHITCFMQGHPRK